MAEVPYVGELEFLVRSLTQRLSDVMQECRPDEGGVALSSLKKQLDIARHQKIVLELELLNNAKKQVEASVQAIVESSDDKERIALLQANNVVLQQKLDACHVQLELKPKEESSLLTKRLQKTKEPFVGQQQQPFGPPPQIQQVSPQASTSSTRELQARLQALKAFSAIAPPPPPPPPMVQSKPLPPPPPPPQRPVATMPLLLKNQKQKQKEKVPIEEEGPPRLVYSKRRSNQ